MERMKVPIRGVKRITLHCAYCDAETFIQKYRDVETFEGYCKVCPRYGASWACPPFNRLSQIDFSPFREVAFIGIQTFITDDYQQPTHSPQALQERSEGVMTDVRRLADPILFSTERDLAPARLFLPGSCHLCDDSGCTRTAQLPCRHPQLMRPSLEAVGFNIALAAEELLHIHLHWPSDLRMPPFLTLLAAFFLTDANQSVDLNRINKALEGRTSK